MRRPIGDNTVGVPGGHDVERRDAPRSKRSGVLRSRWLGARHSHHDREEVHRIQRRHGSHPQAPDHRTGGPHGRTRRSLELRRLNGDAAL